MVFHVFLFQSHMNLPSEVLEIEHCLLIFVDFDAFLIFEVRCLSSMRLQLMSEFETDFLNDHVRPLKFSKPQTRREA